MLCADMLLFSKTLYASAQEPLLVSLLAVPVRAVRLVQSNGSRNSRSGLSSPFLALGIREACFLGENRITSSSVARVEKAQTSRKTRGSQPGL